MRVRKHMMLSESDGVVALPGGSGTLEELFEAMTLKRLGLYTKPIVLVNTRNYFEPLIRGEDPPKYGKDGIPDYVRLKNVGVKKKLAKYSIEDK